MTDEQKKFIELVSEEAKRDYVVYRIFPSLTIAQAILESGWGKSELAIKANNLFGIKASNWNGETYTIRTIEHKEDGTPYYITAEFRKYNDVSESIKDHSIFLLKERYRPVLKSKDYKEACVKIRECGYATDINYSKKLINIIETYGLYKYDEEVINNNKEVRFEMNLKKLILVNNECYIRNKDNKRTPKGIVVHSTGANNPNLKRYVGPDDSLLGKNTYNNHWNTYRPGCNNADFGYQGSAERCSACKVAKKACRQVCVHAFIGKLADGSIATYQVLPFDIKCWGVGSGKNGSYNPDYIQFEICEDARTDSDYFNKVYKEAVEFTAYLCFTYNIEPVYPNIVDHSEAYKLGKGSNHGDVGHWFPKFNKSMDTFRKDVAEKLKEYKEGNKVEEETKVENKEEVEVPKYYRVGTDWKDGKCIGQIGAYTIKDNAINASKAVLKVFDWEGNLVYPINEKPVENASSASGDKKEDKKEETVAELKVGDKVKISKDAVVYGTNKKYANFVYNSTLYVREIKGDRIVISTLKSGDITGPVDRKYIIRL